MLGAEERKAPVPVYRYEIASTKPSAGTCVGLPRLRHRFSMEAPARRSDDFTKVRHVRYDSDDHAHHSRLDLIVHRRTTL